VPEPHDIEIRKNVEFCVHDDVVLTGDYYAPLGAGPYPALIALHGGGWTRGTAEGYQYWGPYLAERGYILFSINYRLVEATRNRYPAAVMIRALPFNSCETKQPHSRQIPNG
jgi:acetyl esterase/lipase